MFNKALVKLTFLYLLIMMAISLFFSFSIYRVTSFEFTNNIKRQQHVIERFGRLPQPFLDNPDFLRERENILVNGREKIGWGLLYINGIILILGGGLSYFLARWTLKPIKETHESQSRFTADASHELRSPLSAMQTEIEVALRDPKLTKEEAVKLLKSNLEEVGRLRILSQGLLRLAQENGDTMSKESLSVIDLIKEAVRKSEKLAKEKEITIKNDVSKDISVIGDKTSLAELITILLDNAIKYSKPKKEIALSAKMHHGYTHVIIKDQGFGIKESDLPHIFDRFYRTDLSRSRERIEGYGLGLSIAQKIANNHKGKIEVQSQIEKGSTFTIKMPTGKT